MALQLAISISFVSVFAVLLVCCEEGKEYGATRESDEEIEDVFIPTKEWQEIKRGQSIPPGLHVRLDFQTGIREAKLMEEEEGGSYKSSHLSVSTQEEGGGSEDKPYGSSDRRGVVNKRTRVFSPEQIHEMMENLNTDSGQLQRISSDTSNPTLSQSSEDSGVDAAGDNSKPKSMLAKDLPITFHRDVEVMMNLSRVLATNSSPQELCAALEELEYYVHQIDNARDLNVIGGMVLVVRLLNHSHPEVRSWAAHVLGSATQRCGNCDMLYILCGHYNGFWG